MSLFSPIRNNKRGQQCGPVGVLENSHMTSTTDLNQVRQVQRRRSLRIAAVLRVCVVATMTGAMLMGTAEREWATQCVLLAIFAVIAVVGVVMAFTPSAPITRPRIQFLLALIDVLMVSSFQVLSDGGYVPLLVMALLPIMVALDVSWQRAAVVLAISVAAFTVSMLEDPVMQPHLGWGETFFLIAIYGLLCCAAWLVVYVQGEHIDEIALLHASRQALLADTMSATEAQRRGMSEAIHDGPLQDVLAARQEIAMLAKEAPSPHLTRAAATLQEASQRLREATFELHPAVLEQVGLSAAVDQLASFTSRRSGIEIQAAVDYPTRNAMEPMVFGVIRELLSNVARHSQADRATVTLAVTDGICQIDVIDDGVGISPDVMARRLSEGHIGLASHRARVDAAGGTFTFVGEPLGTHVRVRLPVR
jgi:two-component system NarL family sensor kinase